ncbi:hypothetical protein BV25DRAFT_1825805, partial [Artomyces pyxidatus]
MSSRLDSATNPQSLCTAAVRPDRGQHTGFGPGALEEKVCLLDSSPTHRRLRSRQGSLGRPDGDTGAGHMGEESSEIAGGKRGACEVEPSPLYYSDVQRISVDGDYPSLHFYKRHTDAVLGCDPGDDDRDASRCFNCGSVDHIVTSCPSPRNHELISLSRQMFNFHRPERTAEGMTLASAGDYKRQRLLWLDTFEPGEIRGSTLRDALGLRDGDLGSDVPWLKKMADWGYPPGWYGYHDPRESIRRRIIDQFTECLDIEPQDSLLTIYIEEGEEKLDLSYYDYLEARIPAEPSVASADGSDSGLDNLSNSASSKKSPKGPKLTRWAAFPSTYFSSALLPVYNGPRLPPVHNTSSSTWSDDRHILWGRILSQTHGDGATLFSNPPPPPSPPPLLPPPPPQVPPPPLPPGDTPNSPFILCNSSSDLDEVDMDLSDS